MTRSIRHFRPFTLVEVLISLSLTTLLLGALFFVYRVTATSRLEIDETLWIVRRELALEDRLSQLTFSIIDPQRPNPCFCTDQNSLVFSYDNGVDVQPHFSAAVLGRLYLDSDRRFILATWPHPGRFELETIPHRQEVLLTSVESMHMRFFEPDFQTDPSAPVHPDESVQTGREIHEIKPGWHEEWLKEYESSPAMLEITLSYCPSPDSEARELRMMFRLRSHKKCPLFWHRKGAA